MSLTVKQDKASQKFVECGDKSQAYRYAYNTKNMSDEAIHVEAHRLFENPKVSLRVEELLAEHRAKHEITMDYITDGLKEVIKKADEKEDITNSRNAYMDLAKLHGLIIEKRENTNTNLNLNEAQDAIAQRFAKRVSKTKH